MASRGLEGKVASLLLPSSYPPISSLSSENSATQALSAGAPDMHVVGLSGADTLRVFLEAPSDTEVVRRGAPMKGYGTKSDIRGGSCPKGRVMRATRDVQTALGDALAQKIGTPRYQLWFAGKTEFRWDGQRLTVGVANRHHQECLQRSFL